MLFVLKLQGGGDSPDPLTTLPAKIPIHLEFGRLANGLRNDEKGAKGGRDEEGVDFWN